MAENEEELKNLLRVKEDSEKTGLKLTIQKTKIMASSPITSWQIEREKWKQWQIFFFLDRKITADNDCSHEIKRHLLLGRKAMTNVDSILKSRAITLLTKVYIVKAVVFPVIMYTCESWTIKKADWGRIDAFEMWCWRRLLRFPRRSNQSKGNQPWIFIRKTKAEAEAPKLWPPDAKSWLIRKNPDAGEDWRQKETRAAEDKMVR